MLLGDSVAIVPHSKLAVVDNPFGLTLPLSIAEFDDTDEAAVVTTVGWFWTMDAVSVWTQRNP